VLADNKLALNAGWDTEMLGVELADLQALAFDVSLTGFSEEEIAGLVNTGTAGLTDPDEVPEPPEEPVAKPGDIWLLGGHRVMCGDSTVVTDVSGLLAGVEPHLMVTDPPYGVDYDPDWRNRAKRSGSMQAYGASSTGTVLNDDQADWTGAWSIFPGDVVYVWHGALHANKVSQDLIDAGFEIRAQIIWSKQHAPISRGHYHWQHEPCFYAVRKGKTGHWSGDRKQTTLWQISNSNAFGGQAKKEATGHGTQKPVECMRRPIVNNSSPGQAVYDPFLGSGTTVIAAEMTGRICYGMELSPAYVDVIVMRWEKFTGEKAERLCEDESQLRQG
jgi:DNA modification methylase